MGEMDINMHNDSLRYCGFGAADSKGAGGSTGNQVGVSGDRPADRGRCAGAPGRTLQTEEIARAEVQGVW